MFERFRTAYAVHGGDETPWRDELLLKARGYQEFATEFAGATFARGIYRFHDEGSGPRSLSRIRAAFPEYAHRARPFAYDWLGREFVLDAARLSGGEPLILILEPGTGQALEVPVTFEAFHEAELVDYSESALAASFFDAWAQHNSESLTLERETCVGYRIPLFLGGRDDIANLKLSDLDVYWSMCGQLLASTWQLPRGTTVDEVTER